MNKDSNPKKQNPEPEVTKNQTQEDKESYPKQERIKPKERKHRLKPVDRSTDRLTD